MHGPEVDVSQLLVGQREPSSPAIDDVADPPAPALPMRYYAQRTGWQLVNLAELRQCRELIWILGLRDLKVRYRQTLIGVAWAVLQPLTLMLIFTAFFRLLGHRPVSGTVPYEVSVFCGLLPWQLFAATLTQCTHSLVVNRNLVTKVYFPRLALPLSTLLVGLVDFAIGLVVLTGLMTWCGVYPGWPVLALPVLLVTAALTSIAVGLWLAALNAIYRDVEFVVPFLVQVGFFVSPVVYETAAVVPAQWRWLYALNPMVGVLDGFRWALLGAGPPPWQTVGMSLIGGAALLAGGLVYFRRMERFFADRI
jgi:lipopolysaccharide transport system permease protein